MSINCRIFSLILFFFPCSFIHGQFNTVTIRKEYKKITEVVNSTSELVATGPTLVSEPNKDSIQPVQLFHLPLEHIEVNSYYGYRQDPFTKKKRFHYGIDLSGNNNDIYAIMPGKIKDVGYKKKGLGNYIILEHGDFTVTYAHMYISMGKKGDIVKAGDVVGVTGNTGRSTGEHLHISMKLKDKNIDPLPIIRYIESHMKRSEKFTVNK